VCFKWRQDTSSHASFDHASRVGRFGLPTQDRHTVLLDCPVGRPGLKRNRKAPKQLIQNLGWLCPQGWDEVRFLEILLTWSCCHPKACTHGLSMQGIFPACRPDVWAWAAVHRRSSGIGRAACPRRRMRKRCIQKNRCALRPNWAPVAGRSIRRKDGVQAWFPSFTNARAGHAARAVGNQPKRAKQIPAVLASFIAPVNPSTYRVGWLLEQHGQ